MGIIVSFAIGLVVGIIIGCLGTIISIALTFNKIF